MYIIDSEKLQEGDIVLTRDSNIESELIRQITNSEYSHAILYVGAKSCIQSNGNGVHSQNLMRLLFEKEDDVIVLRIKENQEIVHNAVEFARQKIGTSYSSIEAKRVRHESEDTAREPNRQFCTRFIAQVFEQAGKKLVRNSDYCSPQDILESPDLDIVKMTTKEATQGQVEFANSESPLDEQNKATNDILESAREIFSADIQDFQQLFDALLKNPQHDSRMVEVLQKSGYLELWKGDIEKNPHYYDLDAMYAIVSNPKQRIRIASFLASAEEDTRSRFVQNRNTILTLYNFSKLEYFKLELDLYNTLIELSKTRQNIAQQILFLERGF